MFFPWYPTLLLAAESNRVMGLRLMKLAGGGHEAFEEAALMVNEKIDAAIEAGSSLMAGGDLGGVIDLYRQHVAANAVRLA